MADSKQEFLYALHDALTELEKDIIDKGNTGRKIARRTTTFLRAIVVLFFVCFIFLVIQAFWMANDIKNLGQNMVQMYTQFGEMADEMDAMGKTVSKMQNNVQTIPKMTSEMHLMVDSVGTMKDNIATMKGDVVTIEGNLGQVTGGVSDMASRFTHLNGSVYVIHRSIRNLSSPIIDSPLP